MLFETCFFIRSKKYKFNKVFINKTDIMNNIVEALEKIAKKLAFKGVDIQHNFEVDEDLNEEKFVAMKVTIDVDKLYKESPTYDEKYRQVVNDLDYNLRSLPKYLGISKNDVVIMYYYINTNRVSDLSEIITDKITKKIYDDFGVRGYKLHAYLSTDSSFVSDLCINVYSENTEPIADIYQLDKDDFNCNYVRNVTENVLEELNVYESFIVFKEICGYTLL